MKALAAAGTGLAGLVSAVAAGGWYGLAGIGVVLAGALGASCWVIGNRARTLNAVALIIAARSRAAADLGTGIGPTGADAEAAR
jgi:hypothetical protein